MPLPSLSIRSAYSMWPQYNRRLRDVIVRMTDEQVLLTPGPDRWPIWATVGHLACQRVFWFCDFAGMPGADKTPFTDAGSNCPGDDYLEPAMTVSKLVEGLDSSFRIIENALNQWTVKMLDDQLTKKEFGLDWVHTRAAVIQRVFTHDMYHCGELSQTLGLAGLTQIDPWD